jgi:hypothetical protein
MYWESMVGVACIYVRVMMVGCVDGCRDAGKAREDGANNTNGLKSSQHHITILETKGRNVGSLSRPCTLLEKGCT